MRWNDHLRIGLLRQHRLRYRLAVVGAIAHESVKRCCDLIEQIRHGRRVAHIRRRQFARKNLMMFVDREVQLAPSAPGGNVMFFLVPFVFPVYLEPCGVHDDDAAWGHGFAQGMSWQADAPLGNAAEIRNADLDFQGTGKRVHEAFGLPQCQIKNLTYEQRGLDCHIGVFRWPAARPGLGWAPLGYRLLGKPHRKVATPLERGVVRRPVRHLVKRLLELVATVFAVFVRHVST